jgi:sugar lactone lactonase YvrE
MPQHAPHSSAPAFQARHHLPAVPAIRARPTRWRTGHAVLAALACAVAASSPAQVPPLPTEAPAATQRLADAPRRAQLGGGPGGIKFTSEAGPPTMVISNPYLDPLRTALFVRPVGMQCAADGGIVLSARGGLDAQYHAHFVGWWRVAADGAVTPLLTRSTAGGAAGRLQCDTTFAESGVDSTRFALDRDGQFVVPTSRGVLRMGADGRVQRLAGAPRICKEGESAAAAGLVDGPADEARFDKVVAVAVDGEGHAWVADQGGCALRRVAPDGRVSTVLAPERVCVQGTPPAERVTLRNLAWDATRGELVAGGEILSTSQLTTTVWRIRPDGTVRRVLLGHKLGASPAGTQLDGVQALAVDPQGRIHIASRRMEQDVPALLRVDEARGSVQQWTGMRVRPGSPMGGEVIDGPAERARFVKINGLCFAPDGTAYVQDDSLVRRIERGGNVSTWAF